MALEVMVMVYEDAVLPRVPEPSEPLAAAWRLEQPVEVVESL